MTDGIELLNNPTKDEIIDLVRSNSAVVVWITKRGAIVRVPGRDLLLLPSTDANFFNDPDLRRPGVPIVLVHGNSGLAATDPSWDGSDTFTCDNPQCACFGSTEDMDLHVHDSLWKRAANQKKQCRRHTLRRCRKN